MMKKSLLLLGFASYTVHNIIGDCTTPATFTASVDPSSFGDTVPTKVELVLPKSIESQLSLITSLNPGTTKWEVDGSVKMQKSLGNLGAKLSYDAAKSTLYVTIGDGVSNDAMLNSQCSTSAALTAIGVSSHLMGMNKKAVALSAMLGVTFWNQFADAQAAETCDIEGTILIKHPAAYRAQVGNTDLEKGPYTYNIFLTNSPTLRPTTRTPTEVPTAPTNAPTHDPTKNPTKKPTLNPTKNPTKNPTRNPTRNPTKNPTKKPTNDPTKNPTRNPTKNPTKNPTNKPTTSPTLPYTAYVNELARFAPTGTPTDLEMIEIVYHRQLVASLVEVYVYEFISGNTTHVRVLSGFPQSITSAGWTAGTSYCNNNLKIAYKEFDASITPSRMGIGLSYNGVAISGTFVGNLLDRIAADGPFHGIACTSIPMGQHDPASIIPPNGLGSSLVGSGSKRVDFSWDASGDVARTMGSQNTGQTFCPTPG